MKFSIFITQLLEKKVDKTIRRPSDCDILALDIESVTGEHVGVNTVKRLLGFKSDEREPRQSTLDIFARYLGYKDWNELHAIDSKSNSDFGDTPDCLNAENIDDGKHITFTYLPDRSSTLQKIHGDEFRVTESENGKLQIGDKVRLSSLMLGYPLLITNVLRNGQELGSLLLGKVSGLTSIKVEK